MSAILFHRLGHDAVVLRGSERAYTAGLVGNLAVALLDGYDMEKWIKPILPSDHYIRRATGAEFQRQFATAVRADNSLQFRLKDGSVDPFTLSLNTALAVGNDAVKLLTRLHGQSEIHCWIEGKKDRRWLADIIDKGRKSGVMRPNQGWENVSDMLDEDDGLVVCSYTICESFPNFGLVPADHPLRQGDDEDGENEDKFSELPVQEQWALCMQTLQQEKGLKITKKDWDDFYFMDGTSALNLRERAHP